MRTFGETVGGEVHERTALIHLPTLLPLLAVHLHHDIRQRMDIGHFDRPLTVFPFRGLDREQHLKGIANRHLQRVWTFTFHIAFVVCSF